ncbi:hypothetical protein BDV96DRAFT_86518 [Lophiotrema nucula]|uniref:Thiaminase-2/PQQC domain-containing protein n=1 Tax=Lophiotrema nucula TaxID=690887 RepID=A0A6A5Z7U7_9PLEO|nr:hypothetical protein BDV96DRAFT_86518 [Lophiotrema nucula]
MSSSLTSHLLSQNQDQFKRATQSPFLKRAAEGKLPKNILSDWLANDRLYMQGYIHLTGELLRILQLPQKPVASKDTDPIQVRLLDWLVDALVNIRREERFFLDVAERYGIDIDISNAQGKVEDGRKIEGLKRFEKLFEGLTNGERRSAELMPWLEGVVVFWATEKVYFTAWSWAKEQVGVSRGDEKKDADGGAMRIEFIPNWTNEEFIRFVDTLEGILNQGVREAMGGDEAKMRSVEERAGKVWKELLDAEEAFWPVVEE